MIKNFFKALLLLLVYEFIKKQVLEVNDMLKEDSIDPTFIDHYRDYENVKPPIDYAEYQGECGFRPKFLHDGKWKDSHLEYKVKR